jgi:hypothetical protein
VPSPSITILLINILDSAEAYSPRVLGQDDEGSFERPSKRSKCSCRTEEEFAALKRLADQARLVDRWRSSTTWTAACPRG